MRNYFQISNSLYGEVYFRISKHLGILPSEVIRRKFTPDMRFLIIKYTHMILREVEQSKELEEKMNN